MAARRAWSGLPCLVLLLGGTAIARNGTIRPKEPDLRAEEAIIQTARVPEGASDQEIVMLSTRVVPAPRQMIWHRDEFIAFIHFGPNTFSRREWGTGGEDPKVFNPTDLDTDQWCDVMERAGMRRVVLTVKHHDGMCLWQTRYTKHSVASSDWRDGRGDVLRDLSESCRKHGIKLGVYLSPADLYQIGAKDGLYGNGSRYTERVVPRPVEGRPFKEKRTFRYVVDDYNEYFLNQLFELLTEYGPIYECWFDGAHPKRKGGQTYTYAAWYEMIHALAPDAVISVKGPDTRWCGNEAGNTRETEFNVIPLHVETYEDEKWPDRRGGDLASRKRLRGAKWLHYYPAETNTSIRHGWFYRDDDPSAEGEPQSVRTADDVFDIYERSVGGNSVFLLNIPPNREGRFSRRDVDCLLEVGRRIREVYGKSLSEGATGPAEVLDDGDATFWRPDGPRGSFEIRLAAPTRVNRFVLQEAIATEGQRVEAHALDAWIDGEWREVRAATAIGYKRILRFPGVEADRFRVRVTASRAAPAIASASAHCYDEPPNPVHVSCNRRNRVGLVAAVAPFTAWHGSVNDTRSQHVHYTLDGSEPAAASTKYAGPFDMPEGGVLKARTVVGGRLGPIATRVLGFPTEGWKIVSCDSVRDPRRTQAERAIDGSAHHGWLSKDSDGEHHLAVDVRKVLVAAGFTYLPPNDPKRGGMVERYRFEVSRDGEAWTTAAEGEFGNIVNDPSKRTVYFEEPLAFRCFRFVSLKSAGDGRSAGAREIEVLGVKHLSRRSER